MSILHGDFDTGDAISLGAIVGFAEESIQAEEEGESDPLDGIDWASDDIKFTYADLKKLAKTNPDLFRAVLIKSVELQVKYEAALTRELEKVDPENAHELIALAKTEKLLEK
jgi:tRNA U34 5-carboxymethylaminomethyl modifying enzyme MnmG/GidA